MNNTYFELLAIDAVGLNLNDSEDRAIFRERVADRLRFNTIQSLRDWGAISTSDRFSAVKSVANSYIASLQEEEVRA
jgi:hypothetical protein